MLINAKSNWNKISICCIILDILEKLYFKIWGGFFIMLRSMPYVIVHALHVQSSMKKKKVAFLNSWK